MAMSKTLVASLVFALFVLQLVESDELVVNANSVESVEVLKMDCGAACKARCQLSSRPNLCKRACGTCCNRCNCVPPGTSGNQEVCPCYFTMTTRGGKRKCP